jgi:hypothetical protein
MSVLLGTSWVLLRWDVPDGVVGVGDVCNGTMADTPRHRFCIREGPESAEKWDLRDATSRRSSESTTWDKKVRSS